MRPLVNDSEYDELVELSAEFETSIASRLQRYLWLKWIWSDNYVSDWWEEYVYLSSRSPLMINSNYYGLDCVCEDEPFFKQVIRASSVPKLLLNYCVNIFLPLIINKIIFSITRHLVLPTLFTCSSVFVDYY